MPYIEPENRPKLDQFIEQLTQLILNEGELNYVISKLCFALMMELGGKRYKNMNSVIGVLECAKMEFYRRIAAEYEDKKIIGNGDVFDD